MELYFVADYDLLGQVFNIEYKKYSKSLPLYFLLPNFLISAVGGFVILIRSGIIFMATISVRHVDIYYENIN